MAKDLAYTWCNFIIQFHVSSVIILKNPKQVIRKTLPLSTKYLEQNLATLLFFSSSVKWQLDGTMSLNLDPSNP